jgi:hypothetical protein
MAMKCVMSCDRAATHVRIGTVAYALCGHCAKEVLFILRDAAERAIRAMTDTDSADLNSGNASE